MAWVAEVVAWEVEEHPIQVEVVSSQVEPCQEVEAARSQVVVASQVAQTSHLGVVACGAWEGVWVALGGLQVDQVAGVAFHLAGGQGVACSQVPRPSCWGVVAQVQWWAQGWEGRQQTVGEVCQPGIEGSGQPRVSQQQIHVSLPWSPS